MDESQEIKFSEIVGKQLASEREEVRSLWTPISQEFDRRGPDAAKRHLDGQQQGLKERVERLLDLVD